MLCQQSIIRPFNPEDDSTKSLRIVHYVDTAQLRTRNAPLARATWKHYKWKMSLFIAGSLQVCKYTVWGIRGVSLYYSQRYTRLPLSITCDVPRTQFSTLQYGLRIASGANPSSNPVLKGAIHSQLNWAILLCDVIPDGKTE